MDNFMSRDRDQSKQLFIEAKGAYKFIPRKSRRWGIIWPCQTENDAYYMHIRKMTLTFFLSLSSSSCICTFRSPQRVPPIHSGRNCQLCGHPISIERFQSNAFNRTLSIQRFQSNAFIRTLSIKRLQLNALNRTLSFNRFQSNTFNRTLLIYSGCPHNWQFLPLCYQLTANAADVHWTCL